MVLININKMLSDAEQTGGLLAGRSNSATKNRRRYWPLVAWALCLAIAAFNVYYTWCLHVKIGQLDERIDWRSGRLMLDKSDLPTFSGGIVGRPTSADEDQEMTEPDPLASVFGTGMLKVEYDYDEQHVPAGEDDGDANEPPPPPTPKRQKRQVDLTSHTQDGVPIFDQGYGIALNRTEGLRIYQSLLANNGGRAGATDAPSPPVLPHHRENSFWRGRKDRARHHGKLGAQPAVLDADVESDFERNRTRHRQSASSSSVEFRSSRVKPSNTEAGSISSSMVQSDQKWARNSAISLGGSPFSTGGDERISAATAPAVLTKSASAVSAVTSGGRSRSQQHSVFKVTQPSSIPSLSPTPVPVDNKDDAVTKTSPMPPVKKRVNKKQLRDLNHAASAVHLVADTRNATDNQVEIASRNELGLHTSWKMGDDSQKNSLVKIDGAILTVKQSGLYFIYSQVHYLDEHGVNAYEVFVNTEPFLRCVTSATPETSAPKPNTCYTAGASVLREGDKLFLRDIEPLRYSVLQPSKTFFGLVRLAPVSD